MEDLPARMQALGTAQQTGDVVKIAEANRDVIAVGLRAMAELKMAQGDTKQAIDLYKPLADFRRLARRPISRWPLPTWPHTAPMKPCCRSSPSPRSDPKNGDAWNIQGKLLMDKKSYGPAAESLTRSLRIAEATRSWRMRSPPPT